MQHKRKILTSLFFASVMALSLTMSAAADVMGTSETSNESSSDLSISVTAPDEEDAAEDPSEAAEPRYSETLQSIGKVDTAVTPGGTGGYNEFVNYRVSVKIVDTAADGSGLKAKITIKPSARETNANYDFNAVSDYSNQLSYDFPANYDFIQLSALISIESAAFGDLTELPINRNVD